MKIILCCKINTKRCDYLIIIWPEFFKMYTNTHTHSCPQDEEQAKLFGVKPLKIDWNVIIICVLLHINAHPLKRYALQSDDFFAPFLMSFDVFCWRSSRKNFVVSGDYTIQSKFSNVLYCAKKTTQELSWCLCVAQNSIKMLEHTEYWTTSCFSSKSCPNVVWLVHPIDVLNSLTCPLEL